MRNESWEGFTRSKSACDYEVETLGKASQPSDYDAKETCDRELKFQAPRSRKSVLYVWVARARPNFSLRLCQRSLFRGYDGL